VPSIAIILGEGDKLVPRAGAEALKALLPPGAPPHTLATPGSAGQGRLLSPTQPLLRLLRAGVAIHEVREASHQMMQEVPEACIALIEGFLVGGA
jgi:pimeloyl-ACP methyl ester carboxylesterase